MVGIDHSQTGQQAPKEGQNIARKEGRGGHNSIISDDFLTNLETRIKEDSISSTRKLVQDIDVGRKTICKAILRNRSYANNLICE